jgi:hypothetical protein
VYREIRWTTKRSTGSFVFTSRAARLCGELRILENEFVFSSKQGTMNRSRDDTTAEAERSLLDETIRPFMHRQRYGVVSSLSPSGDPQSAIVGVAVTSDAELIFDTLTSTRKYQNLKADSRCSIVLFEGEQTLQFEGHILEPTGEELLRYRAVYLDAWPECRSHVSWPGIAYLVARPHWLRFSDFGCQPPCINEVILPDSSD